MRIVPGNPKHSVALEIGPQDVMGAGEMWSTRIMPNKFEQEVALKTLVLLAKSGLEPASSIILCSGIPITPPACSVIGQVRARTGIFYHPLQWRSHNSSCLQLFQNNTSSPSIPLTHTHTHTHFLFIVTGRNSSKTPLLGVSSYLWLFSQAGATCHSDCVSWTCSSILSFLFSFLFFSFFFFF